MKIPDCVLFKYEQHTWSEGSDLIKSRIYNYPNFISVIEVTDTVITLGRSTPAFQLTQNYPYPTYSFPRDGGVSMHAPGHVLFTCHLEATKATKEHLYVVLNRAAINVFKRELNLDIKYNLYAQGLVLGDTKIAALGIGVENNRTFHGLSIYFDNTECMKCINPCSVRDTKYASLKQLGYDIDRVDISNKIGQEIVDLIS